MKRTLIILLYSPIMAFGDNDIAIIKNIENVAKWNNNILFKGNTAKETVFLEKNLLPYYFYNYK